MVKDAEYYKLRINDLSTEHVNRIRELYKEAASHRFICMSLKELCGTLDLEYTSKSFEANCLKNYVSINSYLEKLNLKLVPCSVPVDLSFFDKIFITPKPDLNNDEDCAAVKELVASKRVPSQKDLKHIASMNIKLTNYNIMLRVFEALFVISSTKLDPHQRVVLNNIISQMIFPKEGLAYIRACYTYASEYRNRHCDYSNPTYCFKRLDDDKQLEICRILALIASSSNYKEPFFLGFPDIAMLDKAYNDLEIKKTIGRSVSSSSNENMDLAEDTSLERKFAALRAVVSSILNSKQTSDSRRVDVLNEYIAKNSPVLKNRFFVDSINDISNYLTSDFSALFPKAHEISLRKNVFRDCRRTVNALLTSANKELSLIYPCICYTADDSDPFDGGQNTEYEAFLRDQEYLKIANSEVKVTTAKANNELLIFTYFIRAILKPLFIEYDENEDLEVIRDLNEEYGSTFCSELLLIRVLHFILFETGMDSSRLTLDTTTRLGLMSSPALCRIALCSILSCNQFTSPDKCDDICRQLFEIQLLNAIAQKIPSSVKWAKYLKAPTHYSLKLMLNLVRENLPDETFKELFDSIRFTVKEPVETSRKAQEFAYRASLGSLGDLSEKSSDQLLKSDSALLKHPVYTLFINPILQARFSVYTETEPEVRDDIIAILDRSFLNEIYKLQYLSSVSAASNLTLAKLISGDLTKVEEQVIKRKLKDLTFQKYNRLCDIFNIPYTYSAIQCIEEILPSLGLMIVPIDMSLPREARSRLNVHKIITTGLAREDLDQELILKLSAAQMAFVIFSFIVPINTAEIRLAKYMALRPEQSVFAIKFLSTLKVLAHGAKPFEKKYYRTLYAEQRNNENYKLCIRYLKRLATEEIETSPLKNYLEEKFNELFSLLNLRGAHEKHLEEQQKSEEIKSSASGVRSEIHTENITSEPQARRSFFRQNTFSTKKLDTGLIESKLKESEMIQDIITQIRDDENEASEYTASQDVEPAEEQMQTDTLNAGAVPEALAFPSENAKKLIKAIHDLSTDVMDLDEFNGLCLSMRFMSRDVAIEEINDWCYETFDDPLFDVAPEENSIYIILETLEKIIS